MLGNLVLNRFLPETALIPVHRSGLTTQFPSLSQFPELKKNNGRASLCVNNLIAVYTAILPQPMQNPFRFAAQMPGPVYHPALTYSSQIHQTSPHSHRHHHSGRCPRCSVHTHTGTLPNCKWQLEHLMLTRESKKKKKKV